MSIAAPLKNIYDFAYEYLAKGVVQSGIQQDGGLKCYQQIPKDYHIAGIVVMCILDLLAMRFFMRNVRNNEQIEISKTINTPKQSPMDLLDKFCAIIGIVVVIITFYFKVLTQKGLFIFNPCHITVLIQSYLLYTKYTPNRQIIHTCWTAWLYGIILALCVPHTNGILDIQFYLYYIEHLLAYPVGVLLLYRKYGFVKPNFINHIVAFGTTTFYQYAILGTLSIAFMVNLNFILCHTPADPWFWFYGYHYFLIGYFVLGFISFVTRVIIWIQLWLANILVKKMAQIFLWMRNSGEHVKTQ